MTRVSAILFAVLLASAPAHAQPANPAADAALAEGRRLYDVQEWDLAIEKFKEAYTLRADAPALFNIAQSYRLKGDCAQAASFYKTFRRNYPKEGNPELVERLIVEMEECAKNPPKVVVKPEVKPEPLPPTVAPPPTTAMTELPSPPPDPEPIDTGTPDAGKTKRIAGLVIGGVGVAGLTVGVVFGLKASGFASDAEGLSVGSTWNPELERKGESAQGTSRIAFGIGAAALIGGGVLYMLGRNASHEQATVTMVPTADGAHVVWSGGF